MPYFFRCRSDYRKRPLLFGAGQVGLEVVGKLRKNLFRVLLVFCARAYLLVEEQVPRYE
jgi:hypothetical protein